VLAAGSSGPITFEQIGAPSLLDGEIALESGFLLGDFIGSEGNTDSFNLTSGSFALINNFENDVNVNVSSGSQLIVTPTINSFVSEEFLNDAIGIDSLTLGEEFGLNSFLQQKRFIDGDLNSDGDLFFVLGLSLPEDPLLEVSGDVNLNSGSTITINQNNAVTEIGQLFTLIDVGGALDNNATITSINEPLPIAEIDEDVIATFDGDAATFAVSNDIEIEDESALLDLVAFDDGSGDLVVQAVEAVNLFDDLSTTPEAPNTNFSEFSTDIINAFNDDELDVETFQALANLETVEEVAQAIATFQPDTTNSTGQQLFEAIRSVSQLIQQRIGEVTRATRTTTNNIAFNGNLQARPAVYDLDETTAKSVAVQNAQSQVSRDLAASSGVWAQLSYDDAEQDNNSNPSSLNEGYDAESTSIAFGYDYALNASTIIGLSVSYTDVDINLDRISQDRTELDAYQLTAYAWRRFGALQVSGQIGYSFAEGDSQRQTIAGEVDSDIDLDGVNASILASYTFDLTNTLYIAPLIGLSYSDITQDSFTESGSLGLSVGEISNDYFEGRLGFTIGNEVVKSNSATNIFLTSVFVDDFGSGPDDVTISFGNQSSSLSVVDSDDSRVELTLGINYTNENWSFGGALDAEYGDDFSSYGGNVRFIYNF